MIQARIGGTLRVWYGDVGDFVEADDIIAEIETGDGTRVEIAASAAGRITEIHALAGEAIEAGALLAHIDEAPQLLYELLDSGDKPKRKHRRKAVAGPQRRYFLLGVGGVLLVLLGSMVFAFLLVTPASVNLPTQVVPTPMSRFHPGGYVLLREPVGDLIPGTVRVREAFYDGGMWQYMVSSGGMTAQIPESLLEGAPVPPPTPTMIYDYRRWAWSNWLILAESIADFPAGTRVKITGTSYNGLIWQLDVATEGGFMLKVRESQLALPRNPPANPLATPTAAFLNRDVWEGYKLMTVEQVGDIPPSTLVQVRSARYGFDGWIYLIAAQAAETGVEAYEWQLVLAGTPMPE